MRCTEMLVALVCAHISTIGDIVHLHMFGQHIIIVNSHEVAVDLYDKRGAIYSNRPHLPSTEIVGYTQTVPLTPFGDRYRQQRKMLSQMFGSRALVSKFNELQEREVHKLLVRILNTGSEGSIVNMIKGCILQAWTHVSARIS